MSFVYLSFVFTLYWICSHARSFGIFLFCFSFLGSPFLLSRFLFWCRSSLFIFNEGPLCAGSSGNLILLTQRVWGAWVVYLPGYVEWPEKWHNLNLSMFSALSSVCCKNSAPLLGHWSCVSSHFFLGMPVWSPILGQWDCSLKNVKESKATKVSLHGPAGLSLTPSCFAFPTIGITNIQPQRPSCDLYKVISFR